MIHAIHVYQFQSCFTYLISLLETCSLLKAMYRQVASVQREEDWLRCTWWPWLPFDLWVTVLSPSQISETKLLMVASEENEMFFLKPKNVIRNIYCLILLVVEKYCNKQTFLNSCMGLIISDSISKYFLLYHVKIYISSPKVMLQDPLRPTN